jgi:hypothetical protein
MIGPEQQVYLQLVKCAIPAETTNRESAFFIASVTRIWARSSGFRHSGGWILAQYLQEQNGMQCKLAVLT